MNEIEELRDRIAQLELLAQQLEWERNFYLGGKNTFRALSVFCAITIIAMVVMGILGFTTTGVKEKVKAHRVEIVNLLGEVRGILDQDGIRWMEAHSKQAISLAPVSGLYVMDYGGDTIVHLGGVMGGLLHLRSSANKSGVYMSAGVLEEIGGSIAIRDKNGGDIVRLPPEPVSH